MQWISKRILRDDEGSVLVITLLVLFMVMVIGAVLSIIASTDLKVAGNQRFSTTALYSAEAGLNEAIHRLGVPSPTIVNVGGTMVDVSIGDTSPYDPNWKVYIFLKHPTAVPAGMGSIFTTGTIQDPNQPYVEYSVPSGTDGALTIEHKWQDRDGNGNRDVGEVVLYDGTKIPPENFATGFPVEIVTVRGNSGPGMRTIQAEVTKRMIRARTLGALYTDKAISITGDAAFCGYNHDVNTPVGMRPVACNAWHLGAGDLAGVTTTGDDVDVQGVAADLDGFPSPTDTASANPFFDLHEVLGLSLSELNQILAQADRTSMENPFHGITYIQGDADIMSNYVGSGLLYVTGDLKAAGGWEFKGLIFVEGDLNITGTPWILGSVIVRGTSDYNFSAGNCGILYSADAITQYLTNATPMKLLSWREL
ncbi:MAG: hypothetical protein GTO42_08940 [Candidatus Latescibacteria bacterium]|nr:hypothetical protein [Candidatus Latescibacterota bacterium]NIO29087.1 hypothetical protein [Candidatus Latescibacterota bacterium]NIO56712.1 hypothetical protein [Candidatus Latescibacterota bacterium]NIT02295.1 hypothetical protein [Candidatus Latescibacterota bacterium]NIT39180.1 hypothetical protein [Candidatus Latescibacterota bacterium]